MASTPFGKITQHLLGRKVKESLHYASLGIPRGTVFRHFYAGYSPHTNAETFSSLLLSILSVSSSEAGGNLLYII
jgi:hypothetical protein